MREWKSWPSEPKDEKVPKERLPRKVPREFEWLGKLDYPIRFGLNFTGGSDFPCSNALHMLKKQQVFIHRPYASLCCQADCI